MFLRTIGIFLITLSFFSCAETGLFEKVNFFPEQQWSREDQPQFQFEIKDTLSSYRLYFLFRHDDAYPFNNLWLKVHSKMPEDSIERIQRFEIPLATENRWLGTGMSDIFDHRVLLYPEPVKFSRKGLYTVKMEQDMRIDPLKHVLNTGLRIEKLK